MKTDNPICSSTASLVTSCLLGVACLFGSTAPCAALPQSDGTATQERSQRRAQFASVRLEQGLAIGRPSGWRVKRSGPSVMLVPPPSVAVSVVVSIAPWDAARRLGDEAEQERLRQTHLAAAPGFLAAGEAILGSGWLSLDYERESTSDSDAAMRIFVRPLGDRAVTLAIVGTRSAIDRGERDWISIANTIGLQRDAAESGAPSASGAPAPRDPAKRTGSTGTSPKIDREPKAATDPAETVSSANAILDAVKAVDAVKGRDAVKSGDAVKAGDAAKTGGVDGRDSKAGKAGKPDAGKMDSAQRAIKAGSQVAAALESLDRAGKGGNGGERLETAIDLAGKIALALDAVDVGGGKGVSHSERSAAAASAMRAVSDAIAVAKRDGTGNSERIDAAAAAVRAISESLQGAGLASGDSKGMQDLQKAVLAAAQIANALRGVERDANGKSSSSDLDKAINAGAQIVKALQGDGAAGSGNLSTAVGIASAVSQAVKAFDNDGKPNAAGDQTSADTDEFIDDEDATGASDGGWFDDGQSFTGAGSSDLESGPGTASPAQTGAGEDEIELPDQMEDGDELGADAVLADLADLLSEDEGEPSSAASSKRAATPSGAKAKGAVERGTKLKLVEGWIITLPRGWSAVKSDDGFQLRPPSKLLESAGDFEGMVGIVPWDASARIRDESVLADLRAEYTAAHEGFRAIGEPTVRADWARFDFEADVEEGGTMSARIFVRPIGSQAVAILVAGSRELIESLRDEWNAMADSVRVDSVSAASKPGGDKK